MTILRANGKILRANGSILKAEWKDSSILYKTYYDSYDANTRTDKPKVGGDTVYSNTVNLTELTWGGKTIPFAYPNGGSTYLAPIPVDLPQVFSAELVVFAPRLGSMAGGSPFGFSDKNNTFCTAACLTNVMCLDVLNINLVLKNNSYVERRYSNHAYVCKRGNFYNSFVKCSFVFDNESKIVKCYFDGTLVATFSKSDSDFSRMHIRAYKYSSFDFFYSQVCIRNGDCSINDGNNYPIEDGPYI